VGETKGSWGGSFTYDFVGWIVGGITNGPPVNSNGEGWQQHRGQLLFIVWVVLVVQ